MRSLSLARDPLAPLPVDACDDCQAMWLDATESQQMTPGAVLAMFQAIAAAKPTERHAYRALLPCPRCTTPLSLTKAQSLFRSFCSSSLLWRHCSSRIPRPRWRRGRP